MSSRFFLIFLREEADPPCNRSVRSGKNPEAWSGSTAFPRFTDDTDLTDNCAKTVIMKRQERNITSPGSRAVPCSTRPPFPPFEFAETPGSRFTGRLHPPPHCMLRRTWIAQEAAGQGNAGFRGSEISRCQLALCIMVHSPHPPHLPPCSRRATARLRDFRDFPDFFCKVLAFPEKGYILLVLERTETK